MLERKGAISFDTCLLLKRKIYYPYLMVKLVFGLYHLESPHQNSIKGGPSLIIKNNN